MKERQNKRAQDIHKNTTHTQDRKKEKTEEDIKHEQKKEQKQRQHTNTTY